MLKGIYWTWYYYHIVVSFSDYEITCYNILFQKHNCCPVLCPMSKMVWSCCDLKSQTWDLTLSGRSLIWRRMRMGPGTMPCLCCIRREVKHAPTEAYWQYLNDVPDPENDDNGKKFCCIIKSQRNDNFGVGTLRYNSLISQLLIIACISGQVAVVLSARLTAARWKQWV